MVDSAQFFDESKEQSQIKARIVEKYFVAWARVIMATVKKRDNRLAYIDLFAGPGRYQDGTISTPLLVIQKAVEDADLRQRLVTFFNDKDPANSSALNKAIAEMPGVEGLRWTPQVKNEEVGDKIVKMFEGMKLVPTLFFVDPWGYKGLSLGLINSVLKDWGCDCIFFLQLQPHKHGLEQSSSARTYKRAFRHGTCRLRAHETTRPFATQPRGSHC